MNILLIVLLVQLVNLAVFVRFRGSAAAKILAVRHQLLVLEGSVRRPAIKDRDRLFYALG